MCTFNRTMFNTFLYFFTRFNENDKHIKGLFWQKLTQWLVLKGVCHFFIHLVNLCNETLFCNNTSRYSYLILYILDLKHHLNIEYSRYTKNNTWLHCKCIPCSLVDHFKPHLCLTNLYKQSNMYIYFNDCKKSCNSHMYVADILDSTNIIVYMYVALVKPNSHIWNMNLPHQCQKKLVLKHEAELNYQYG
jgi:hypothetical protein